MSENRDELSEFISKKELDIEKLKKSIEDSLPKELWITISLASREIGVIEEILKELKKIKLWQEKE